MYVNIEKWYVLEKGFVVSGPVMADGDRYHSWLTWLCLLPPTGERVSGHRGGRGGGGQVRILPEFHVLVPVGAFASHCRGRPGLQRRFLRLLRRHQGESLHGGHGKVMERSNVTGGQEKVTILRLGLKMKAGF